MLKRNIAPAAVWHAFDEIIRIPRGEGHMERVADYICNEAQSHGLNCHMDRQYNVVVWVPATEGRTDELPVILQAHLDMALMKTEETEHEFEEEGLELIVDGDWIHADGTEMGADDGIGVAMMMALFRDHELSHPGLELVFTADKELGISTAKGFDISRLKGRRLINLDCVKEGLLINGTAGVMHTLTTMSLKRKILVQGEGLHLKLSGLPGGHSALEGDWEQDNAIQLMGRLLTEVKDQSVLVDIRAEQPMNLIPEAAEAVIITEDPVDAAERISELFEKIRMEKKSLVEAHLLCEKKMVEETCYRDSAYDMIMAAIALMPVGLLARDSERDMPTLSNNLCSIEADDEKIVIGNLTRYAFETLGENFSDRLNYLAELLGGEVSVVGNIPVWEPEGDANLMDINTRAYKMQTGGPVRVALSHGAAETAVLMDQMEGLEAIAIGPEIHDAHTTNEAVSISSVQRTFDLLKSILATVDAH